MRLVGQPKVEPSLEEDFWTLVAELERLKHLLQSHRIEYTLPVHWRDKALITKRRNRATGRTKYTEKQRAAAISNGRLMHARRTGIFAAIDVLVARAS